MRAIFLLLFFVITISVARNYNCPSCRQSCNQCESEGTCCSRCHNEGSCCNQCRHRHTRISSCPSCEGCESTNSCDTCRSCDQECHGCKSEGSCCNRCENEGYCCGQCRQKRTEQQSCGSCEGCESTSSCDSCRSCHNSCQNDGSCCNQCQSDGSCCNRCNNNGTCCDHCRRRRSCCEDCQSNAECLNNCDYCRSTPPAPAPPVVITPCPPSPLPYPPASSKNCSIVVNPHVANNNNITIPINITNENTIRSETVLTIPINVTLHNINNINIKEDETYNTPSVPAPNNEPARLIPIPIPFPLPQQSSSGCCNVIQPCVPAGCQTNNRQCGSTCESALMYHPYNPCEQGCERQPYQYRYTCNNWNRCNYVPMNCSQCPMDFYKDFSTFYRCGGCFKPSPVENAGTVQPA